MVQKISVVLLKLKKGNTLKYIAFSPKNFKRDEPFHLNFRRNYSVLHTNVGRSCFLVNDYVQIQSFYLDAKQAN